MVHNTLKILDHEDAILKEDPDHFKVISLRTPSRRVAVYRRGDLWRCSVDKTNSGEQPCSHILAVLIYEGYVDLPNTAAAVWSKGQDGRDHSVETRAWEKVPTRFPELLARLLQDSASLLEPPPERRYGRAPKRLFPQAYQAVMRVAFRQSLRVCRGSMQAADHHRHNPYGPVGVATLCRFLANPATTERLEKLLALTTWPARPYETLVHPDGTGLTEQHFSAYFDERYAKDRQRREAIQDGPRKHRWSYAEILWTYRYTLIAAIHTEQSQFGEAPWLIPLLQRASLMLDIGEVGGDKAYDANYIYRWAREHGMDPQIKVRRGDVPKYSHQGKKYRKAQMMAAKLDPEGYAAKANRRNNAETGNHAFKMVLGDQIYSKNAVAQRNEVLCMCIAYNLFRLIYLETERDIQADFAGGVQALRTHEWVPLERLRADVDKLRK